MQEENRLFFAPFRVSASFVALHPTYSQIHCWITRSARINKVIYSSTKTQLHRAEESLSCTGIPPQGQYIHTHTSQTAIAIQCEIKGIYTLEYKCCKSLVCMTINLYLLVQWSLLIFACLDFC